MALVIGNRIGPFELTGWLGAGGMGEVYSARDTRLGREVAIKLLADRFATDSNRLHRFEQEGHAAGQLNHPNVLVVHDIGVHDRTPYIVSELLAGESLRMLLRHGALTPRRAIEYARQTAEGLAAAHAKGVVHRDLKPDNLFVTTDDRVKILDFGLAKLTEATGHAIPASGDTEIGAVLGTTGYMSPEQARGEVVDVRTDIFSLGIILHEMLTGKPPFARASAGEAMAAVLKDDPLATQAGGLPPALERIVRRCLEKTREARFQSARDLAFALDGLSRTAHAPARRSFGPSWARMRALPWLIVGAVCAPLLVAVIESRHTSVASPVPLRLNVDLGGDAPLGGVSAQFSDAVTISPDGTMLAFVAQRAPDAPPQLYVRHLDEPRATMLAGTEGANAPFFSPDAAWIGFETGLQLKKVAVTGGAPILVSALGSFRGAAWQGDGTLIFSPDQVPGVRLMRLSSTQASPVPVTKLSEGEALHTWPQILPGDRAVLYTSTRVTSSYNDGNLVVQPLPSGVPKVIQRGGYHARYVRSGHVLYVHDGSLFALPFDVDRLEPTGPAVRVLSGLRSNPLTGGAQYSISDDGTLVYLEGPSLGGGTPLDLVDRRGGVTTLRVTPTNWFTPAFTSDGNRIALAIRDGPLDTGDIWVYDVRRGTLARVTSDPARETNPVWTHDGRRLAFASDREPGHVPNLFWQSSDGSTAAERLTTSPNEQLPGSWHPSGRFLAFEELHRDSMRDVMILPIEGNETSGWKPGTPWTFVQSPEMDWEPRFSPDGRWLAYASGESGKREVYVRPFPGPGPEVRVSVGGGELPTWSATTREIVYGLEGQLMVVPYVVHGSQFEVTTPRAWEGGRYQSRGRNRMFDVHPDGKHVVLAVAARPSDGERAGTAQFVFNFFSELRRLAPGTAPGAAR